MCPIRAAACAACWQRKRRWNEAASAGVRIAKENAMRPMRLLAAILLLGLAACAGTGQVIPQEQAVQFQQAAGFPYNSFSALSPLAGRRSRRAAPSTARRAAS